MSCLSRHCVPICPSSYPYNDEGYFNFVCLFIVYFIFVRSIFCLFIFSNLLDLVNKDTIRREKWQWRWPLCAREKYWPFSESIIMRFISLNRRNSSYLYFTSISNLCCEMTILRIRKICVPLIVGQSLLILCGYNARI